MKNRLAHLDRNNLILCAILLLSMALRVAAALYMGNTVEVLPGTFDQVSYHNLALRLISGHGFTFGEVWWPITAANSPTAHWSFLYTFYLAIVYTLFGANPVVARLIQAVIVGLLHPWLAYLLGRRIFNPTVGLIAAGITAVYIYFIYYAGTLMTEPFYISLILAGLYLAIRLNQSMPAADGSRGWLMLAFGMGVALGAAVLLRQLFLLTVPFIFLWMWWSGRKTKNPIPLRSLLVASVVIILMIIPFAAFNYQRFHRFVLLNTNAGYAFFWGNHPIYGTNFVPILTPEMGSYQELIPEELRQLDEAALDQALLKRGLQFISDDPMRYLLLSLSRIPHYFMFWPSSESGMVSNLSRLFSFGVFLPFMVYGLVLGILRMPKKLGDLLSAPESLLIGFGLVYTVIHILTWTLIRYRLPVDAILVLFAGLAVWVLIGKLGFRRDSIRELKAVRQP